MYQHDDAMDARGHKLEELLGASPTGWWRAPGRVNLIGDHTDYCEGFVLPMAIDRDCLVAVAPTEGSRVRVRSLELDRQVDVDAGGGDDTRLLEPGWGRFVAGAVQVVTERGARVPGLELALSSTVPSGSGLSSSSALTVALTLALASAGGLELDRRDAARAALDAEVRASGVPGGLMDQLASLFGEADHALLIDCRSLDIEAIRLPRQLAVVVVHSGLPRTLAGSEYGDRRAACERAAATLGVSTLRDATLEQVRDDPRARHVVTENARVLSFADALRSGDVNSLGPRLLASHASLRDDFDVSTPELDLLVELLVENGASGARLTGAGFGGCVVALCQRNRADNVLGRTVERYRKASGLDPLAFVARASSAARHSLVA
jgi:galactokinase